MTTTSATRYDPVAVALHWTIAIAIIIMIPFGLLLEDIPKELQGTAYGLHKSIGITILVLSVFRLVWRLLNPPPALPEGMKPLERTLAKAGHWAFYVLMLGMPMTGWLLVSAAQKYPTILFWMAEVPYLPLPADMVNKDTAEMFGEVHELLAYGTLALLVLHVGAALKHHLVYKDNVLTRMLPLWAQKR
jgi:cytochrome b561